MAQVYHKYWTEQNTLTYCNKDKLGNFDGIYFNDLKKHYLK